MKNFSYDYDVVVQKIVKKKKITSTLGTSLGVSSECHLQKQSVLPTQASGAVQTAGVDITSEHGE